MPRIQMTRSVKVALFFLRVYLIVLLALILIKFVGMFSKGNSSKGMPSNPPAATSQQKK